MNAVCVPSVGDNGDVKYFRAVFKLHYKPASLHIMIYNL